MQVPESVLFDVNEKYMIESNGWNEMYRFVHGKFRSCNFYISAQWGHLICGYGESIFDISHGRFSPVHAQDKNRKEGVCRETG
jgi:hypothetical protein